MLPLIAVACSSDDPKPEPEIPQQPEQPEEPEKPEEPVDATTAYFQGILSGTDTNMPEDKEISAGAEDLKSVRDEIWSAWKKANQLTDTERLPNLMAIDNLNENTVTPNGQWKM